MTHHDKMAVLAGGCFWGMQDLIRKQPGVVSTRIGYTGGQNRHPTYHNHPGHAEAIEITYDPDKTDYRANSRTGASLRSGEPHADNERINEQHAVISSDDRRER